MSLSDDQIGFDPRRWVSQSDGPAAAAVPAPGIAPFTGRDRALIASAALLMASAPVVAWLARVPRNAVARSDALAVPRAARASAPKPVAPDVAERSATLPDAGGLAPMLVAQGVPADQAAALARLALPHLAGGGAIEASVSLRLGGTMPEVLRVAASRTDSSGVVLSRDETVPGGWRAEPRARALENRLVVARGEMNDDSLYSSAVAAGVDEALIPDFAQAFVYDFDFQREIHPGDVFEMAAEQTVNAAGEAVGAPKLVYARFQTADKARALYRFTVPGGAPAWFDGNGRSIVRSLMRTPVEGARVSSTFGWRVHPVLGFRKLHNGIDFAVPSGTPVYAAGAGTVVTAHFSATAGNMVILQHEKGYLTKYFHFTSFAPGVHDGATVSQGQEIGLSGTTGRSTGPHLHYEVHLNGEAIDPMSVRTEDGATLTGETLAAFRRERDRIDAARAAHTS